MGRALRVRGCEPRGVTELRKELSGVADVVDGDDAVNDGIERRRQEMDQLGPEELREEGAARLLL